MCARLALVWGSDAAARTVTKPAAAGWRVSCTLLALDSFGEAAANAAESECYSPTFGLTIGALNAISSFRIYCHLETSFCTRKSADKLSACMYQLKFEIIDLETTFGIKTGVGFFWTCILKNAFIASQNTFCIRSIHSSGSNYKLPLVHFDQALLAARWYRDSRMARSLFLLGERLNLTMTRSYCGLLIMARTTDVLPSVTAVLRRPEPEGHPGVRIP